MKTPVDLIKERQLEIEGLQKQINNCKHEYGEAHYDPKAYQEPYGHKLKGQGSDVWFEPEGYTTKHEPRWSKTCKKCGYKKYTTETKAIQTAPDFGD